MPEEEKNKQVLIHAGITMLHGNDIMQYISNEQYAEIKKRDADPIFVMMSTGHEGEAVGELYESMATGAKAKKWFKQLWPLKAIKELVSHFLRNKKTPVFDAHEIGAAHRYVIGHIIHSLKRSIDQITHAIAIAHIHDYQAKIACERGDFDACSIEAECLFGATNSPLQYEVVSVENVSGVALCNTRTAPPAFAKANILAVVAAMAENKAHKQGVSNMADGDKVVTFRDVQDYIREHRTQPDALFKVEELTAIPAVKSAFETDFEVKTKELREEKEALAKEIVPFKKAARQAEVEKYIRESALLKDEPKATVAYLVKTLVIDITEAEKPQEVVDVAVKHQLEVIKSSGVKIEGGSKDDEHEDGDRGGGDGDKSDKGSENTGSGKDYTNPKDNDLIPTEGQEKS